METTQPKPIPILEIAWTRFAQFDAASLSRSKSHLRTRLWVAILGVLATFFAILSQVFPPETFGLAGFIIRILLILTPLLASFLAGYVMKTFAGGDWLVKRAGAEEILKEIYMFRTVLQKSPKRRAWLEKRLTEIQRQVFRGLGGELTIKPYEGQIPPYYDPENPNSDPGFNELTGEEYFQYRLAPQLAWHTKEINEYQTERTRLTVLIGISGVVGALLAALDQTTILVALASSFTAAFIGWQELRNVDAIIRNYSKVIMELSILYDHWRNLETEERSSSEFFKMVRSTEEILWSQNVEYIKSQQEALKDASLEEEAGLINRVIQESVNADARLKKSMSESLEGFAKEAIAKSEEVVAEAFEEALNELAKDASSELVQAELAAMGEAVKEAAHEMVERVSGFASSLRAIQEEFKDVEIGRDTPPSLLNTILSRYPKSEEVKG
ncbi:MAG: DUF4231 domain-containing protein [Chloroflexi bacterium]|nr:DUF4231 domain-containing protein [Chloroflexota bacterium]